MQTISILVKCPQEDYKKIEEICINAGIDATRYFLELHYGRQYESQLIKDEEIKEQFKPVIFFDDNEHREKGGYLQMEENKEEEEKRGPFGSSPVKNAYVKVEKKEGKEKKNKKKIKKK